MGKKGKKKLIYIKYKESVVQQRWMCVYIFADTVDFGFVWMKGNTFIGFEE